MKEQGVVRLGILNEPAHSLDDIRLGGDHARVLLVVGQDDHVLAAVPVALAEEGGEVLGVVDAAAQLALLAEVVDADQQGFALPGTVRVLEGVALWRAVAELLRGARRGRAGPVRSAIPAVSGLVTPVLTVGRIPVRV